VRGLPRRLVTDLIGVHRRDSEGPALAIVLGREGQALPASTSRSSERRRWRRAGGRSLLRVFVTPGTVLPLGRTERTTSLARLLIQVERPRGTPNL
jgi:hypothetical protein